MLVQIVLGGGICFRSCLRIHACTGNSRATYVNLEPSCGPKVTYDDDMSYLVSRHFFEGRTVVGGPHRLDRPPRLRMNIDAIILNIVKGREGITNHYLK